MPTSITIHISDVLRVMRKSKAKSFLDIGCGFGRWGLLARDIFDIMHCHYTKDSWQTRIDGVEAFADYITPIHNYIYNNVYIEKIEDFIKKNDTRYDVIFAGDILEHLEKEPAQDVIKTLFDRCNHTLIIAIPLGDIWPQGSVLGNVYETHRSTWYKEDFKKLNASTIKVYKLGIRRRYAVVTWCKITKWQKLKANLQKEWHKFLKRVWHR